MLLRDRLPDPETYFESRGLKLQRGGKWRTTSCPFHGGSDSLRVNLESGAFVCMAGCGAHGGDVVAFEQQLMRVNFVAACRVLGAWANDPPGQRPRLRPLGFAPRDGLELLLQEARLVAVAAANLGRGVNLTDADRQRLLQAAGRVSAVAQAVAR